MLRPVLTALGLLLCSMPALSQDRSPRIFLTDSVSWEVAGRAGGARPQSAEIAKTFSQRCPTIRINNRSDMADFVVVLEHEGGKGYARKDNKVAVYDWDGDLIYAGSTAVLGNAAKDACTAIKSEWRRNPRPETDAAKPVPTAVAPTTKDSPLAAETVSRSVFVDMERTESHTKRSSADVAYALVDAVTNHLKAKGVAVASGKSPAQYHLRLIVDRPVMKWVKVTVEAYGDGDQPLWTSVAESGGGLSGEHGLRVATERLQKLIDGKLGEVNGLPLAVVAAQ